MPAPPSRPLPAHTDAVTAVTLSPDGAQVVVASDKLVRLAALANGQTTRELTGASSAISSVAASPGTALVAAGADRRVLVWQTKDGKLLGQAVAHGGAVTGQAFNPAGNQLVSAGKDGKVRLWAVPPVPPRSLVLPDVVRAVRRSREGR